MAHVSPVDTETLSRRNGLDDVAELAVFHARLARADSLVQAFPRGLHEQLLLVRHIVAHRVCEKSDGKIRVRPVGESDLHVALRSPWKLDRILGVSFQRDGQ